MTAYERATVLLTLVVLWCSLTALKSEAPRVAFLKPIPRIVRSDDEISLKVRVEPSPENRLLVVAAIDESGEVVRRTDEQLDGEAAPRTRWVRWTAVPAGDLLVIAEAWDSQKPLARARTPLCVTAPFGDPCPSLTVEP